MLPRCSLETCPHSLNILRNGMGVLFETHISHAGTEPSSVAKFDLESLTPTLFPPTLPLPPSAGITVVIHLLESQFSVVMGGGANGEALWATP